MQPVEVPPYPWHTVTTDHDTGFAMTAKQHSAVAVFGDQSINGVILVPCTKESSGAVWAQMFVDHVHVQFMCTLACLPTPCLIGIPVHWGLQPNTG